MHPGAKAIGSIGTISSNVGSASNQARQFAATYKVKALIKFDAILNENPL